MSDLDERIREAMERSTAPADPAGAFERVVRMRARHRRVRRAQTVALTAAVVVVTSGVTFTLGRMFGSDRRDEALETPPSVPDIAFAGTIEGKPGIYAIKADGSDVTLLTKKPGRRIDPSWSPDGTKLAYSDFDDDLDIYVLDLETGKERQVTDSPADDTSPAWSPDGTKLAFVSQRQGGSHLYLIDADGDESEGSPVTRLTSGNASNYDPAWSADGTHIYFAHDPLDGVEQADLYALNAPSASQPEPSPPVPLLSDDASVFQPASSPDGTKLAFVSQPDGVSQIFVANADGSKPRQLTDGPGHKTSPSWSPDGRRIVFSSGTGMNDLFMMNADGTNVRQITELNGDLVTPAWNPRSTTPPEPDGGSEGEPRCLSEDDAALEPSLRRPGSLRGDVDGDGTDDEVSIAIDPEAQEACRYFLVVATSGALTAARIDPGMVGSSDDGLALAALLQVDDGPGRVIVVDVRHGAATTFAAAYAMRGAVPTLLTIEGLQSVEDSFAYGGSLSGLSGVDCTGKPGIIVVSGAHAEGSEWIVERNYFSFEDGEFRLYEQKERHRLSKEELEASSLEDRFPEFEPNAFPNCPGAVRADGG